MHTIYCLTGGVVIDPEQRIEQRKTLLIKNGKVYTTTDIPAEAIVIDCAGKIITPGFIDVHTHLRDPGQTHKEDIYTGSCAAVTGGVTTIFCMPNTTPVIDTPDLVKYIIDNAHKVGLTHIYPVAAMTYSSAGKTPVDFDALVEAGAISFSDDGVWVHDSALMETILRYSTYSGVRVIQHCEDKGVARNGVLNQGAAALKFGWPGIPAESEEIAVYRDVALCGATGAKLHIAHISTAESLCIVEAARQRGIDVTCEVAPHHLLLSEDDIPGDDARFKVNPPLRTRADCDALLDGVIRGTIDMIATDHAPHAAEEKKKGFLKAPCGMIGLEFVFALLYTHLVKEKKISLMTLIERMTIGPARSFGLEHKGTLRDGADADIAVIDLDAQYVIDEKTIISKSKNTPFLGWEIDGKVTDVFINGACVYRNGEITTNKKVM